MKLIKGISKKFSTLVVPDPNKLKDVPNLLNAAMKFKEDVRVLQLACTKEDIEKYYSDNKYGINVDYVVD